MVIGEFKSLVLRFQTEYLGVPAGSSVLASAVYAGACAAACVLGGPMWDASGPRTRRAGVAVLCVGLASTSAALLYMVLVGALWTSPVLWLVGANGLLFACPYYLPVNAYVAGLDSADSGKAAAAVDGLANGGALAAYILIRWVRDGATVSQVWSTVWGLHTMLALAAALLVQTFTK